MRWATPEAPTQGVAATRIVASVHYRDSSEVGLATGRRVGERALERAVEAADHWAQRPPARRRNPVRTRTARAIG